MFIPGCFNKTEFTQPKLVSVVFTKCGFIDHQINSSHVECSSPTNLQIFKCLTMYHYKRPLLTSDWINQKKMPERKVKIPI